MARVINEREERALVMEHAVQMGDSYGVPVDTARKLLGHEAVEMLMGCSFAGLYWNVCTDWRGSVKYLTVLGFIRAVMNYNMGSKCDIIPFRQRARGGIFWKRPAGSGGPEMVINSASIKYVYCRKR